MMGYWEGDTQGASGEYGGTTSASGGSEVGGGGGLIGGIIGSIGGMFGGGFSNRAGRKAAHRAQDFAQMMANTAHQREVADLRAAGLNPILSATGGRGAPSPQGVMPEVKDITRGLGDTITKGVDLYFKGRMQNAELQSLNADTELKRASQQAALADAQKKIEEKNNIAQQTSASITAQKLDENRINQINSQISLNDAQQLLVAAQQRLTTLEQEKVKAETDYNKKKVSEIDVFMDKMRQEMENMRKQLPLIGAQTKSAEAQAGKTAAETPKQAAIGEAYSIPHKVYKKLEKLVGTHNISDYFINWNKEKIKGISDVAERLKKGIGKDWESAGESWRHGIGNVFGGKHRAEPDVDITP